MPMLKAAEGMACEMNAKLGLHVRAGDDPSATPHRGSGLRHGWAAAHALLAARRRLGQRGGALAEEFLRGIEAEVDHGVVVVPRREGEDLCVRHGAGDARIGARQAGTERR